jgi:hypothetical protein
VLTLAHAEPSEEQGSEQIGTRTKALCAEADGFSLHAGVRCAGHERDKLERLARYVARPALAFERVRYDEGNGHVTLQLKTPWRDGTTHLRMSPLEFMQRLAALVPPARLHLTRFHGVLAPNARLRPLVIPAVPPAPEKTSAGEGGEAAAVVSLPRRASYVPWGKLLRRVFKIDLAHCPCCGGTLRIIAAIMERETIERILNHLKLPAQAPPRTPAFAGGDLLAV